MNLRDVFPILREIKLGPDMKVLYCSDYDEMSQLSCDKIVSDLKMNPKKLMCTATGNSPIGLYGNLANVYKKEPEISSQLSIVKLDEWGGINLKEPNSCETFIREKILWPLNVSEENYISFFGNPISPKKECERIQIELQKKGPIDICILGLGQNGHIGFNEPADELLPRCHIGNLSKETLEHQMINTLENKPIYGFTLGMADILQSKKIILLITGANKKEVIQKLLSKKITTYLPASFLWLHDQVECFVDKNAM